MTSDINLYITLSVAGLAGLGMVTMAGLSGWRDWLALKRQEIGERTAASAAAGATPVSNAGSRIEIADLKERIRKLEAIAAGVDL